MKFSQLLLSVAALAASAPASPLQEIVDKQMLPRGPPASACYPNADPDCKVPAHCQCANGWIYYFNPDNYEAGGNGCDPPWGYIGKDIRAFPGSQCN